MPSDPGSIYVNAQHHAPLAFNEVAPGLLALLVALSRPPLIGHVDVIQRTLITIGENSFHDKL
jgi:hypothetical protein